MPSGTTGPADKEKLDEQTTDESGTGPEACSRTGGALQQDHGGRARAGAAADARGIASEGEAAVNHETYGPRFELLTRLDAILARGTGPTYWPIACLVMQDCRDYLRAAVAGPADAGSQRVLCPKCAYDLVATHNLVDVRCMRCDHEWKVASASAPAARPHFRCSEGCGVVAVDEDGCCRTCGADAAASAPAAPRETTKEEKADMSPGNPASDGDEHPPSTPNDRAIARRIIERIASETLDYRGRVHFKSGWAERIIEQELSK
jgi:hypothetical protein